MLPSDSCFCYSEKIFQHVQKLLIDKLKVSLTLSQIWFSVETTNSRNPKQFHCVVSIFNNYILLIFFHLYNRFQKYLHNVEKIYRIDKHKVVCNCDIDGKFYIAIKCFYKQQFKNVGVHSGVWVNALWNNLQLKSHFISLVCLWVINTSR